MITARALKMIRWLGVAACAAGAVASYSKDSAAGMRRLFYTLSLSNPNCTTDTGDRTIFAKADGLGAANDLVCSSNHWTTAGNTGEAECGSTGNAVHHQAFVQSWNTLTNNFELLKTCSVQNTWANTSTCTYTIPAHGSCGGSDTATAASFGIAYP
jgi:hypothetical protein